MRVLPIIQSWMQILQIKISKSDFEKYKFESTQVKFSDLVQLITNEYARETLLNCNEIAEHQLRAIAIFYKTDRKINLLKDPRQDKMPLSIRGVVRMRTISSQPWI